MIDSPNESITRWGRFRARPRWQQGLAGCGSLLLLGGLLLLWFVNTLFTGGPAFPGEALPPAAGAQGPRWSVTEVDGIPVLLHQAVPYPTEATRPETARVELNGTWQLRLDDSGVGVDQGWHLGADDAEWEPTTVPSTYNAQASKHRDHYGVAWFRRRFTHDPARLPAEGWARLCFRGVLLRSTVWLNGVELGDREGGHTPFYFDVTEHLRPGVNVLVVRADNRLTYTSIPPRSRESHRPGWAAYGGIYRPVWIDLLPSRYLSKVAATPRASSHGFLLDLQTVVHQRTPKPCTIRISVEKGERVLGTVEGEIDGAQSLSGAGFELPLAGDVQAWSPATPELYRVRAVLLVSGEPADELHFDTGLRTVSTEGSRLLLNGDSLRLRGIAKHEDHPVYGATVPPELDASDWDLLEGMHVNFVRLSHYPHATPTIRHADRRGVTLMEEIPLYQAGMGWLGWLAWDRRPGEFPMDVAGLRQLHDPELLHNVQLQLIEMVERDRNSPAIVCWSVGNECFDLGEASRPAYRWMRDVVRAFDSSRPVSYSELTYATGPLDSARSASFEMDLVSINMYYGWYYGEAADAGPALDAVHARFGDKPVLVTECGAGAGPGRTNADGVWEGEGVPAGQAYSEEYQAQVLTTIHAATEARDYMAGICPWVFADFRCPWFPKNPVPGYNCKGVLSKEREPKQGYRALAERYGRGD